MDRNPIGMRGLVFTIVVLCVSISTLPNGFSLSMENDVGNIQVYDNNLGYDDIEPPVTTATTDPPEFVYNGWYRIGVGVTLNATDNESGVNVTYYKINDEDWEIYTEAFRLWVGGIFLVQFYSIDNAGNEEIPKEIKIKIDDTPPVIHCYLDPPNPNGLNGWYVTGVWLTLNVTDNESGVWRVLCNGKNYTGPILIIEDGQHDIKVRAIDNVGNLEEMVSPPRLKIDQTTPVMTMFYRWEGNPWCGYVIIITLSCTDAMSGMSKVEFYFNDILQETITGAGPEYVWSYEYTIIPNVVIKGVAYDEAGNTVFKEIIDPTSFDNLHCQSHSVVNNQLVNLFFGFLNSLSNL